MKVQGEILCTGEDPLPAGIPTYCLYLKKAVDSRIWKGQNNI